MEISGLVRYELNEKTREFSFTLSNRCSDDFITLILEKYEENNRFRVILKSNYNIIIKKIYIDKFIKYDKDSKIMVNGYETWTESKEFEIQEKILPLDNELWHMRNQGDYEFYKYSGEKGVLHSYGYTYIRKDEEFNFIGSIDESLCNTIFEHHTIDNYIRIIKECEGQSFHKEFVAFDIISTTGNEDSVFYTYFSYFKKTVENLSTCTGWTSWYYYYNSINEDIILKNLENYSVRDIPIDVFQIDDGYQSAVGDWLLCNDKFKNGMGNLANKIKEKGYKAGIWLAPFVCEKNSQVYKNHKNWILRDLNGEMVIAGHNSLWSGEYYTLNFYNEEFRSYLKEVFKYVIEIWGYDIVKLDFLYAVAIEPRENKTRGKIMREAMEFLRELCGTKMILGCGVPLISAVGLTEYCRVGSDVALTWEEPKGKMLNFRERNSTFNSITSTIGRRGLNGRAFISDPDVFILRSNKNEMSFNQRYSLLLINCIFGGLVFTSDNIEEYSEEEMDIYMSSFPLKEKKITRVVTNGDSHRAEFAIENKNYLLLSNLNPHMLSFNIPFEKYFNTKSKQFINTNIVLLEPYETCCLLKVNNLPYEIIGDDCCLFAGSMIEEQKIVNNNLYIKYSDKFIKRGNLYLSVPDDFKNIIYNEIKYDNKNVINTEGINYIEISIRGEH